MKVRISKKQENVKENANEPIHLYSINPLAGIKDIKRLYGNLRIFSKLILTYLILLVIVCSVSLLALQITLKVYDEQLYLKSVQVLNFFIKSTENEYKNVEKLSLNTAMDSNIQEQLTKIKTNLPQYDQLKQINTLKDKLLLQSLSERNLSSISFIDNNGQEFTVGKNPPVIEDMKKNDVITKADQAKGGYVFVEPNTDFEYLISARKILKYENVSLEPLGTLIFSCNIKEAVNQNFNVLQNDKTQLYIYSEGKLIFKNGTSSKNPSINLDLSENQGYSIHTINGKKYFISFVTSEYMKWTYVSLLPYDEVYKNNIMVKNILILIFIALFIITICVSYKIAKNITRPIEDLTSSMKQLERADFKNVEEALSDYHRTDEVGYLQKEFVIMINRINDLIKENYEKQILIKDTEYRALQAQINPHFLYNTLSSINWLIKTAANDDASMMVMSLSCMLRAALGKQLMIPLDEEAHLLESYINIQKIRYEDRAEFYVNIDKDHMKYLVPNMILQPIVENSINYGVENMLEICTISITSRDIGEDIEIIIDDNGPGIENNTMEKLRNSEIPSKGSGIGLKNIDDRLKLIFGEDYGVKIESESGIGTRIIIRIPKGDESYV